MRSEIKNGVIISVVVVIIILLVYFITAVFFTGEIGNNKKDKKTSETTQSQKASLYDDMTIAGRIFNQKEEKYLVIMFSQENISEDVKNAISKYDSSSKDLKLYKVNLDEAINKYAVAKSDNYNPTNSKELKVSKNALLTISSGVVTSYVNNDEDIINALK